MHTRTQSKKKKKKFKLKTIPTLKATEMLPEFFSYSTKTPRELSTLLCDICDKKSSTAPPNSQNIPTNP